ncbi:hypothetical protein HK405_007386, partial [Cladochytrium tenue]
STVWSAIFVCGVSTVPYTPSSLVSVGDDKIIQLWDGSMGKFAFTSVDVWDHARADPVCTLAWGSETITSVRFNQTETSILASCGSDSTLTLKDLRTSKPLSKVVLALRTNALAWNPMEAYHFTLANEDQNLYTFDMRKLSSAAAVHTDHVAPVMDVDYSPPTGQEFVMGG